MVLGLNMIGKGKAEVIRIEMLVRISRADMNGALLH